MAQSRSAGRRSRCPLNVAIELLGDPWSLLIVRDMMFRGGRTYGEFLQSGEGIATNMLADRLRKLVRAGVIAQQPDDADRRKVNYRLTRMGLDLAPVLVDLIAWGAKHFSTSAPPAVVRRIRRDRASFLAEIRRRWKDGGPPLFGPVR